MNDFSDNAYTCRIYMILPFLTNSSCYHSDLLFLWSYIWKVLCCCFWFMNDYSDSAYTCRICMILPFLTNSSCYHSDLLFLYSDVRKILCCCTCFFTFFSLSHLFSLLHPLNHSYVQTSVLSFHLILRTCMIPLSNFLHIWIREFFDFTSHIQRFYF